MTRGDSQQAWRDVLRNPAIWRARQLAREQGQGADKAIPTTWSALDHVLPEAGWPTGVLTELLITVAGAGELSLLLPALRAVCAQGRGIALLAPPWLPHARAWESAGIPLERMLVIDAKGSDLLWSAEQILRSGECGAVLVWEQTVGRALNHRVLQRLHIAAGAGSALCFLYRSWGAQANPSPAPLRLKLEARAGALQVQLIKCRGTLRACPVQVQPFPVRWNAARNVPRPSDTQAASEAVPLSPLPVLTRGA